MAQRGTDANEDKKKPQLYLFERERERIYKKIPSVLIIRFDLLRILMFLFKIAIHIVVPS